MLGTFQKEKALFKRLALSNSSTSFSVSVREGQYAGHLCNVLSMTLITFTPADPDYVCAADEYASLRRLSWCKSSQTVLAKQANASRPNISVKSES